MSEQTNVPEQKVVKKVPKKKPEPKEKEVSGRARAKTTVFENKLKQESNTTKIKAEGIGEGKFTNLLSMFDKNKQKSDEVTVKESESKVVPGTIDPNKIFNKNSESNLDKKSSVIDVPKTMSIQERMANLMKESEKTKAKGSKMIDPVLEMRRQEDEDYEEDNSNPALSDDDLVLDDEEEDKNEEEKEEDMIENDNLDDEVEKDKPKNNNDELGGDDIVTDEKSNQKDETPQINKDLEGEQAN
jgi:hypothetical protein